LARANADRKYSTAQGYGQDRGRDPLASLNPLNLFELRRF
jgi:hypothetical protein